MACFSNDRHFLHAGINSDVTLYRGLFKGTPTPGHSVTSPLFLAFMALWLFILKLSVLRAVHLKNILMGGRMGGWIKCVNTESLDLFLSSAAPQCQRV